MDNDFLKKLQKAVNEGEFNSDAAKKINEINDLADKKIKTATSKFGLDDMVNDRVEKSGKKVLEKEEAEEINSEYEKRMELLKKEDERNKDIATLMNLSKDFEDIIEKINEYVEKYSSDNEIIVLIDKIKELKVKFYK